MARIKSLFLAANPKNTERLSLDKEIREISSKIQASEFRDSIELISVWAVRPDDLIQSLNESKPQIVHFSGHGSSDGEIVLVDELGNAKSVSASALRTLFSTLKDNIRVVILNACYSRIQANTIIETIDCAVGMSTAITDDAAITFIASFYRALGFGRSVQDAFDQGKAALLLAGLPEENTPELLVKPGVDPNKIILIENNDGLVGQTDHSQAPNNADIQSAENSPPVRWVEKDKKRFWDTLPGILTGIAGVITAITALIAASMQLGLLVWPMVTPSANNTPQTPLSATETRIPDQKTKQLP